MANGNTAPEEATLVHQARAGDKEAFGQLMEMHAVRAYRIAYAIIGNQQEAEDAVQEACVTAFKSIKKVEKSQSFGSWFARIVTSRAYDLGRKKQRTQKTIEKETAEYRMELTRASNNPSNGHTELQMDLQAAIARLPELHRLAIMLRYSEDASTDRIASVLNRPPGTTRRILSESYRMLRLYLEGDKNDAMP